MTDPIDSDRTAAPLPSLTSAERRALKARAHALDPVVMIGDAGLTAAVVAETDRALTHHGLIKVRIFGDDRDSRQQMAAELEALTGSALVQAIGKLVVLWRPRSGDDLPVESPATGAKRTLISVPASVPKKLAAEGKTTARTRVRPGTPRNRSLEPGTTPRAGTVVKRPVGPGLRDARGALDRSVARPPRAETPVRGASGASRSPTGTAQSPAGTGRSATGTARAPTGTARSTGRPSERPARAGGPGQTERSARGAPAGDRRSAPPRRDAPRSDWTRSEGPREGARGARKSAGTGVTRSARPAPRTRGPRRAP